MNHINEGYKFFKEDLRNRNPAGERRPSPSGSNRSSPLASACYTFDNRYTIHAGVRGDYTFRYDNSLDDTAGLHPWASAWNIAASFHAARRSDLP